MLYEYNILLLSVNCYYKLNKVQIAEPNPLKVTMETTLTGDHFYKPIVYLCK